MEIGTAEASQFIFWEYINGIFVAVREERDRWKLKNSHINFKTFFWRKISGIFTIYFQVHWNLWLPPQDKQHQGPFKKKSVETHRNYRFRKRLFLKYNVLIFRQYLIQIFKTQVQMIWDLFNFEPECNIKGMRWTFVLHI